MPTVDRGRLDQHESLAPPRPHPSQTEPEQAVRGAETSMGPREATELMTKSEDLEEESRCVHRAVRSTATVRNANRIGRRMAGSRANVTGFLLGLNNGEGQPDHPMGTIDIT